MMRLALLLFVFTLSFEGAASQEKIPIRFFFEEKLLLVPAGFSSGASFSGNARVLYFKYGEDQKRMYIAFSDAMGNEDVDVGCDSADFLESVFLSGAVTACDSEMVATFAESFVEDHDVGVWRGREGIIIYHSVGEDLSFLFLVDQSGKVIKIDTDFLSKKELREVVDSLL